MAGASRLRRVCSGVDLHMDFIALNATHTAESRVSALSGPFT
jgi:hypothetical protein